MLSKIQGKYTPKSLGNDDSLKAAMKGKILNTLCLSWDLCSGSRYFKVALLKIFPHIYPVYGDNVIRGGKDAVVR